MSVSGTFSRCVSRRRDPLSTEGSRLRGGRFNPVGCPALYLAGTPTLAVAEALSLQSLYEVPRFNPRLLVSIDVSLTGVLDLADESVLEALGLDANTLLGDWQVGEELATTQEIGLEASETSVEGILYSSRIEPAAKNLCVFRDNVRATSRLEVVGYDDVWPLAGGRD